MGCGFSVSHFTVEVHHYFSLYRENRYVLFLTENYAALDILKNPNNYLSGKFNLSQPQEEAAKDVQPFILFGSSFPKDNEYTQVNCNHAHIDTVLNFNLGLSKHQPDQDLHGDWTNCYSPQFG